MTWTRFRHAQYLSAALLVSEAARHGIALIGPLLADTSAQARAGPATRTPTSLPTMTARPSPARKARHRRPGHRARSGARTRSWPPSLQMTAAPARRAAYATGGRNRRQLTVPPRGLAEAQAAARAARGGTMHQAASHGARRASYRGLPKPASTTCTWPARSTSSACTPTGPAPRWTGAAPATWHASNSASPHDRRINHRDRTGADVSALGRAVGDADSPHGPPGSVDRAVHADGSSTAPDTAPATLDGGQLVSVRQVPGLVGRAIRQRQVPRPRPPSTQQAPSRTGSRPLRALGKPGNRLTIWYAWSNVRPPSHGWNRLRSHGSFGRSRGSSGRGSMSTSGPLSDRRLRSRGASCVDPRAPDAPRRVPGGRASGRRLDSGHGRSSPGGGSAGRGKETPAAAGTACRDLGAADRLRGRHNPVG